MSLWTAGGCSTSSEGWTAGGQVTERRRHIPIPMPLALAARRKLASGKLGACPLPTHHPLEAHVTKRVVPTTATPTRVAMIMVTSRAIRDNRKQRRSLDIASLIFCVPTTAAYWRSGRRYSIRNVAIAPQHRDGDVRAGCAPHKGFGAIRAGWRRTWPIPETRFPLLNLPQAHGLG